MHRAFHQEPRARGADLTLAVEDPVVRTTHGRFEVRIREDDVRALATQFECHALHRVGGVAHDLHADLRGSGEGDLVHTWMLDQGCARRAAPTRDDIEGTGRESGVLHDLSHRERRKWRFAGRLENDRAACSERRSEFPAREVEREIPRNDRCHYAYRFPHGVDEIAGVHRQDVARELVGPAGVVLECLDAHRHVDLRLEQRFAVLQRFEFRYVVPSDGQ